MTAAHETSERELLAIEAELNAKAFCWIRPNGDREAHFGFTRAEVAIIQSALAANRAAGDAPAWMPIETAPKHDDQGRMVEVIIAGGTYINSAEMGGEYELSGWALACFDGNHRDFKFKGENSGTYDEFYYYKPTHWMPRSVIPPVPRPERGGAAE